MEREQPTNPCVPGPAIAVQGGSRVKSDKASCKNATTRDHRPAPASERFDLALAHDPSRSQGTGMKADNVAIDTQWEALQRQASRITRWHLGALGITATFCIL